jgi:hypothetical protein
VMYRKIFILGTGAALASWSARSLAAGVTKYADQNNGQFGADLSGADLTGVRSALLPSALVGTLMSVQNAASSSSSRVVLDNLPTVSTQGVPGKVGAPGSCEAQSFGYCLGAYTAARNPNGSRKWSADDPANQPSAAWLYQWAHQQTGKTCPSGSAAIQYAKKLVSTGSPSVADYPYNPHDATTVPGVCSYIESLNVTAAGSDASHLLVGSYKVFKKLRNAEKTHLDAFKALIQNGQAIGFSGLVAKEYTIESPPLVNGAFTAPQGFISGSGHGQVIVGYDDSKGPRGAFLVQNSFGPGWNPGPSDDPGHNGRIWWGYGAWFKSQNYAIVMYPNLDEAPIGTKLPSTGGSGAVDMFVRSAKRYSEGKNHYAVLVLHAADAITLSKVEIAGKKGKIARETLPTAQAVAETMRFGYTYVQRATEFLPGQYEATISATTQGGQSVTYHGPIEIT